ncbi:MAG TPA: cell wall-binding repeat-containing protein, partial [Egibacteraceae bacterium]|nr:cell wall-binding repeat-containing protein [Egibacteraceae bacterium]
MRRHRGATRIETAVEVAKAGAPSATEVIVARAFGGEGDPTQAFADSLAAGAWAASSGVPVLLTESGTLSAATQAYLESSKPARAFVVGGTGAVSDAVLAQIASMGIQTERVSGPTRFDTAVEIAKQRGMDDATDGRGVALIEGQAEGAWAPGFAAAGHAARKRLAVLLANGDALPEPTAAYLAGGDDATELVCAAQLAEAACDAASQALGKQLAPTVTLNEGSVAQYADVTGTVEPPEEVLSLTVSGCGLADRSVLVDADGSYATRIEGSPGECTLTFTLKTRTRGTFTKTFSLTVTEAAPATSNPELVEAQVVSTGAQVATVRYVFSEVVRATSYENTATDRIPGTQFVLYAPRGVQTTSPQSDTRFQAQDPLTNPTTDLGSSPRRDPDNNRAVLVDFLVAHVQKATTAVALKEAAHSVDVVEGQSYQPSLPGSAPLKQVQFPEGRTDLSDLVSVGSVTAQNMPPGEFKATFTFDLKEGQTEADSPTNASAYGVVLADGRIIPGKGTPARSGTTATVTFAASDTRTPDGTVCTEGNCPPLQEALTGVRRGYVLGDGTRPLQAAPVVSDGVTVGPDLVSVAIDVAGGTADFTFDDTVSSPDVSKFSLYLVNGSQLTPTEPSIVSQRVVRVKAAVSKLVVGGGVAAQAVSGPG